MLNKSGFSGGQHLYLSWFWGADGNCTPQFIWGLFHKPLYKDPYETTNKTTSIFHGFPIFFRLTTSSWGRHMVLMRSAHQAIWIPPSALVQRRPSRTWNVTDSTLPGFGWFFYRVDLEKTWGGHCVDFALKKSMGIMNQGNIFVSLPKNWYQRKKHPTISRELPKVVSKNNLFCRFLHEGTILKEMSFGVSSHEYWDSCPCWFFGSDLGLANIRKPLKHPAMFCQPKNQNFRSLCPTVFKTWVIHYFFVFCSVVVLP